MATKPMRATLLPPIDMAQFVASSASTSPPPPTTVGSHSHSSMPHLPPLAVPLSSTSSSSSPSSSPALAEQPVGLATLAPPVPTSPSPLSRSLRAAPPQMLRSGSFDQFSCPNEPELTPELKNERFYARFLHRLTPEMQRPLTISCIVRRVYLYFYYH